MPSQPVSVALVNDYPVIVRGLYELLRDDERLAVVELDSLTAPQRAVDVVLMDTFASEDRDEEVSALVQNPRVGRVVIYTWNVGQERLDHAQNLGASAVLSKALDASELADGLLRAHAGEAVFANRPLAEDEDPAARAWPGREAGLSARESEVVSMIAQGATNEQIAKSCYLSINSVKSYIRSAYRKMGVKRRSQAVIWGIENGMTLKPSRIFPDQP